MQKVKEQMDSNFSIRIKREDLYLRSLGNLVLCSLQTGEITRAESYLVELQGYKTIYHSNTPYRRYLADLMQLMVFNKKGNHTKSLSLISSSLSKAIKDHPQFRLTQEYSYQVFQTITALINLKYYKKAKKIILNYITENKSQSKKDAYNYARIVYMILLIEENHDDLLENELKSVYRHFKKEKQLFLFESAFLHFTNRLLHPKPEINTSDIYRELCNQLNDLKTDPFEKNAFVYFEFDKWATNKISEV